MRLTLLSLTAFALLLKIINKKSRHKGTNITSFGWKNCAAKSMKRLLKKVNKHVPRSHYRVIRLNFFSCIKSKLLSNSRVFYQ